MIITPNIFCIVVTYNGINWIEKCLSSLMDCSLPIHVVVIDNASTDNTVEQIETYFPDVQIINSGANLGFGRANNIGLKVALDSKADFVFLLNQDAWIKSDCIEKLIQAFECNPAFGIISPVHLNASGNNFDKHFAGYVNARDCPEFLSDKFFGKQKQIYPVHFINAAAWMLSAKVLIKVGGFDPLFFHYGEDDDYVERVKYAGFKVGIIPNAFICHDANAIDEDTLLNNSDRLRVHHLVQLKKVSNTYRSNWLNFLKSEWDIQTTMLLFRKFGGLKFRFKNALAMISWYGKIKSARIRSKDPKAFL